MDDDTREVIRRAAKNLESAWQRTHNNKLKPRRRIL